MTDRCERCEDSVCNYVQCGNSDVIICDNCDYCLMYVLLVKIVMIVMYVCAHCYYCDVCVCSL